MSRPKKTEAEIQAMREKILAAALSLLKESGPEAVTSRAIAEQLGVAHMSLFTYFENQAAIWTALRERVVAEVRASFETIEMRAKTEDIPFLIHEIWEHLVAFAKEKPHLYRLAWVMPEIKGMLTEENRQELRATVAQLGGILKSGMERGDFEERDPFLAASTVLGMINLPFILFHTGKLVDVTLRDRMVDEMYSAMMLYLGNKRSI